MAKLTPGFKLYLYQLLARELGYGKQTLLPQVEAALLEDDIIPADLECETVQELVEACSDFLKVTVFKKGRVYATVLRNEEWDQMLQAPAEKQETPKKAAGGPKTWKKKKGGKKSLKPVKPGKARRDREAAEAREAAARAEAEALEEAAREQAEAEEREEQEATDTTSVASETASPVTDAHGSIEEANQAEGAGESAPETLAAPASEDTEERGDASKAMTVAETLAASRAQEAQEAAQRANAGTAAEAAASTTEPQPSQAEEVSPAAPVAPQAPQAAAEAEPSDAPAQEPHAQTVSAPSEDTRAEATDAPAQEASNAAQTASAATEPEVPAAPEPAPISLTITYDPYADMERELERQHAEQPPTPVRPQPEPQQTPAPASPSVPAASVIPLGSLPQDFGTEVGCKDALLRSLYQLLPYDVDPMAVLDEDWRMARSTGSLSGSRTRVTFPLRYLHEDGTPITATLRKATKTSFGKQWSLILVDGDDGTGETHLSVGLEGLPAADEGAWSDLSGRTTDVSASPIRMLAEQVVIGTWDGFLGALSAAAAPERWNYPGEGVGRQSRFGILREYIATTYLRAVRQERVAVSADGAFAAFHTGLSTSLDDDIFACLTKRSGDIPWQFAGFATAGSGELGARLAGTIAELPLAPTYLSTLDDVVLDQRRMVILDTESILGRQLGRLPRAFLSERLEGNAEANEILAKREALSSADLTKLSRAIKGDASAYRRLRRALDDAVERTMRAARASYRLAAPVFDPSDDRTKLLVPLCLVEDAKADCALVLDLQPSGAYRAAAILPLPRAYACARVVSREQPEWLAAKRVL